MDFGQRESWLTNRVHPILLGSPRLVGVAMAIPHGIPGSSSNLWALDRFPRSQPGISSNGLLPLPPCNRVSHIQALGMVDWRTACLECCRPRWEILWRLDKSRCDVAGLVDRIERCTKREKENRKWGHHIVITSLGRPRNSSLTFPGNTRESFLVERTFGYFKRWRKIEHMVFGTMANSSSHPSHF